MHICKKYFIEIKKILIIAIPVILTQTTQTAMSFVDTIMAGSMSTIDMAAIAIGSSIWFPIILFGHGLLLSITPIISQLYGANQQKKINKYINQAYWLALLTSFFIMIILWNSFYLIKMMNKINYLLALKVIKYLQTLSWGVPGYLLFQVIRNQYEGQSKTNPGLIIGFLGLLLNIFINYIFIFGNFGMPAMGSTGCGIATATVYWIMFIMILIWFNYDTKKFYININIPNWKILYSLINLGLPIALSLLFEVSLFAVVAILISPLGIIQVSSHQIALNVSSLLFVLPFSIGVASTIRVGFNVGRNKLDKANITCWSAQIIGILIALLTAVTIIIFRSKIVVLYSHNNKIIELASKLILFAGLYQFPDSIQAIGSGILRGYKDTKTIFLITFFSYWVLGLPIGCLLSLTNIITPALGIVGFWYSFIIGLTSAAIMILIRILKIQILNKKE